MLQSVVLFGTAAAGYLSGAAELASGIPQGMRKLVEVMERRRG